MSLHVRERSLTIALALALVRCDERPLEPRSRVTGPRVIDMIAEPPEVRPGELTEVRVMTGGMTVEPTYTWFVCARAEGTTTFVAQSTFGQAEPNDACFGDAGAGTIQLPFTGPSALVATPPDLLARVEALRAVYGRGISTAQLLALVRTAGLPLTVAVEIRHTDPGTDGGAPRVTVLRAFKRVTVVDRAERNRNPPPPSFRFGVGPDGGPGGVPMRAVPDEDRCEPADGLGPLTARPGQLVEIAPDPTEAPWLERYPLLDSDGRPAEQTETAFYSFYATGGAYRIERSRIPVRNTIWEPPGRGGEVTHWFVVRDGRGGTSACRYAVHVSRDAGTRGMTDASLASDARPGIEPDPDAGANLDAARADGR